MSGRFCTMCCFTVLTSATLRAEDVRWRYVATRGDTSSATVRTFYKPAYSSAPRGPRNADSGLPPTRIEATSTASQPNQTAVIRSEETAGGRGDRDSLEREIGVECSRHTREYSVRCDPDGRVVVVVCLRSSAEWNALIARIRALPDLGGYAVIVRGSVP